jgi:hypothetical protein
MDMTTHADRMRSAPAAEDNLCALCRLMGEPSAEWGPCEACEALGELDRFIDSDDSDSLTTGVRP